MINNKTNKTASELSDDLVKEDQIKVGNSEERELHQEEKNAIDKIDQKKREQDKKLDIVIQIIRELKNEIENAGENIKEIGDINKGVDNDIDNVAPKIETQNERLKELVNNIRKSDRICCDIVLILILLGLFCVLYSIIKHKFK